MSSRDPDELRRELGDIQFTGDSDLLSELCSEARETVNGQRDTLNDIDTKASRILRLNVLLIGVIVSALSIAAQNGGEVNSTLPGVDPFINLYMKLGVASLILSTALAALTYTASELDVGVDSDNLTSLIRADMSLDDAQELLVKNYIVRINFNRSTNIRNLPLITSTIVFLVVAVVCFTLGVYEAVIGSVQPWLLTPALLLVFGVVVISGLTRQTRRAIQDFREWR
jgi:hypothetical protein